ncbi:hypothetical protein COLO4_15635 [Corchorus olitorius]|uniref:Uncharacterized protein n=1 Tax=Corchorus olitorius TaxID=93759 RepID=A0A1R3JLZ7_9ROSI|nr:hypothetical protein COLO4_15635 [Corchorus olitorius]
MLLRGFQVGSVLARKSLSPLLLLLLERYVAERIPSWFSTLKKVFESTPVGAVGEIGLDSLKRKGD